MQGAMGRKEVSSPPHDSLRPSSLVNYYMYYSRAGDWGRGGDKSSPSFLRDMSRDVQTLVRGTGPAHVPVALHDMTT